MTGSHRTAGGPAKNLLRGRRLLLARVAWLAVTVSIVGLCFVSLPAYHDQLGRACAGGPCSDWQLSEEGLGQLRETGLSTNLFATGVVVFGAVLMSVWCAVAAMVFWRRSDDRAALFVALFLVVFGVASSPASDSLGALAKVYPAFWLPVQAIGFLGVALFALFFCLFPDGRFVPRRSGWLALVWVAGWAPSYFLPHTPLSLDNWPPPLVLAWLLGFLLSGVAEQVYRYRKVSGPAERRQTKWAVFGVAAAVAGFVATLSLDAVFPSLRHSGTLTYALVQMVFPAFMLFIPLSIGVAILRSRLYDVDVLVNRALVYGLLTASLVSVYLGVVVLLQTFFRVLVGGESQLAVVTSTLVIAALFNPLRRRIQSLIDCLFYRKKYDAAKVLETFSVGLREETDLETLGGDLVSVARETVQPSHVSLWLREPDGNARKEPRP